MPNLENNITHPVYRQVAAKGNLLLESTPTLLTQTGKHWNGWSSHSSTEDLKMKPCYCSSISNEFHQCCIPLYHQLCAHAYVMHCALYLRVCNCLVFY